MDSAPAQSAAIVQPTPQDLALSGSWTARGIKGIEDALESVGVPAGTAAVADIAGIEALDRVGAGALQKLLARLRDEGATVTLRGGKAAPACSVSRLDRIGRGTEAAFGQAVALLGFVGEAALALGASVTHPGRLRWRPVLHNVRSAGFDALLIVGLLSFLLGLVVAYQGAGQLRRYGANIFVADLVGLSMLREFAPLITAIIVAGRSGAAYAAQIGTMSVTEEIDAMRTLGIAPLDVLVLPKILALLVAMPLLTVFADVSGVFGGMIMARSQLGVGFGEFLERFVKAVGINAYLIGLCKAPVFAVTIAAIGCFQGFRTRGGADSVGRHTTRAVVQSIFLVIVADALFSIAFSALDL